MVYDPAEISPERTERLERFLERLSLEVRRLELVNQALTHRSFAFENPPAEDNERLEFLGDSLLGFVIAEYFYQRFPEANEGELSKKKARTVSRTLLGRVALQVRLGDEMRLGRGEEQTGGRTRPSLLGSALEALIGAVLLSEGVEAASAFIRKQLLAPLVDFLEEEEAWDYKSRLQEAVQKQFQTTPDYSLVAAEGPDHEKTFTVRVLIADKPYGEATASRKKMAENMAAKATLERLAREGREG